MAAKREKIHFESVEELLGAPEVCPVDRIDTGTSAVCG